MIAFIKGILAEKSGDSIVLDVSGVGYQIFVPGQVTERLPSIGETIKIHTYLQVREDAMTLFGFLSKDDLRIFRLLLGVNGIGPRGALAVLSVMTTDDLRFAILGDDAAAIAKTPGIGVKTAKRLILELRDKISFEETFEQKAELSPQAPSSGAANGVKSEAVLALTALGYSQSEALKVLGGIEITENTGVEELLKQALKNMSLL